MSRKTYLALLNPFELLRTKKVLHFNPTIEPKRIEPAESKIFVFDFDKELVKEQELKKSLKPLILSNHRQPPG